MFVYLITNNVNGKMYVGQTAFLIEQRWKAHKRVKKIHPLYNAIKAYGPESFSVSCLLESDSQPLIDLAEITYIWYFNTMNRDKGYNIAPGGSKLFHTDEIRAKLSAKAKARPHHNLSAEYWTAERKAAHSKTMKGNKHGVGGTTNTGRKLSVETKEKMRVSRLHYLADHPEVAQLRAQEMRQAQLHNQASK